MKIKYPISIILFYLINFGLWDFLTRYNYVNSEWASFLVYLVLFIIISILFSKDLKKSFHNIGDNYKKASFLVKNIILPMLTAYIGTVLLTILMENFFAISILPENTENIKDMKDSLPKALTFIMMTVFAPLIEEIVFRESILKWQEKDDYKLSFIMPIISILAFSSIHVSLSNIIQIIYYIPLSFGLTYVYIKNDKEVSSSILAHSLTNLAGFIMMTVNLL